MGCASSGPLAKNLVDGAKDTAGDVAHMGEHALHDLGDAAKGGMEHVKEAIESAVHTAEHGLGTMMDKVEETIGHKKEDAEHITSEMKEAVDALEATEEMANKVHDGAVEEVSEAETVLASEAEDTKDTILEHTTTITEILTPPPAEDVKIEDMEDADDGMGSAVVVDDSKKEVEELVAKVPTPAPTPPPEVKEEPPTLWELEADAILNRPHPSMHASDLPPDAEPIKEETPPETETEVDKEVEPTVEEQEPIEETTPETTEQKQEEEQAKDEEEEVSKDEDDDSIDPDLLEREEKMRAMHLMMQNELRIKEVIG